VVDEHGNNVNPENIGNGTIADLELQTKYWNVGKTPTQAVYISKVIITDLVVYEGDAGEELFG